MDFMPFESIYAPLLQIIHFLLIVEASKTVTYFFWTNFVSVLSVLSVLSGEILFSKIIRVCELRGSEERIAIVRGETFFGVS